MTKSELREITRLAVYHKAGVDAGLIARSLSALIRAARTKRSSESLREYAEVFGVSSHPDYIV